MKKILYIHGLSSSGNSNTSNTLRELLPEVQILSPDLPIHPDEALKMLREIVEIEKPDLIIGTSMGGMFAQKLRGFRKILVNPAFHVSESMRKNIGTQAFLNPRKDGIQTYDLTPELCDAYEKLERKQFSTIDDNEKAITWALFGENDELVNGLDEYKTCYHQYSLFPGGHRLQKKDIEETLLPLIFLLKKY